eukprot:370031-Amphidinium_carterae.1
MFSLRAEYNKTSKAGGATRPRELQFWKPPPYPSFKSNSIIFRGRGGFSCLISVYIVSRKQLAM